MSIPTTMTRGAIRDALEARRAEFVAHDAEKLKEHKAANLKAHKEWQAKLRETAKTTYADVEKLREGERNGYYVRFSDLDIDYPAESCPASLVAKLDGILRELFPSWLSDAEKAAYAKRTLTISSGNSHRNIVELLTWGQPKPAKSTVC